MNPLVDYLMIRPIIACLHGVVWGLDLPRYSRTFS